MFLPEAVSRARVASSVARKTWGLPDSTWPGGPVNTLASDAASWYCWKRPESAMWRMEGWARANSMERLRWLGGQISPCGRGNGMWVVTSRKARQEPLPRLMTFRPCSTRPG